MSNDSGINRINSVIGAHLEPGGLNRFIPEPKSKLGATFRGILSTVGSLASSLISGGSAGSGQFPGLEGNYGDLIKLQLEAQEQMMLMSTYSNIEKSKHETEMAAVRNIRVG